MADAVIYDRGYRAYDGPRRGRGAVRRAIVKDGVRRILGLRRKARRKILPWGLLAFGMIMAAVLIGLHFVAGSIAAALEEGLPSYPELFDLYSRIALLFIAVTGPELIGPDRARGVTSVYFSRPMGVGDYLGAKAVAYLLMASSIYLIPQLGLHLGLAGLSDEGFLSYLAGNLDVLWQVGVVTLAYVAVHGGVLAVLSAYIDRTSFAAAAFLGILIGGRNLAEVIAEADLPGARFVSLLAFDDHPRVIRDWVFSSESGTYAPEIGGFEPWISAVTVAVVAVVGGAWVYRRYRRLA